MKTLLLASILIAQSLVTAHLMINTNFLMGENAKQDAQIGELEIRVKRLEERLLFVNTKLTEYGIYTFLK